MKIFVIGYSDNISTSYLLNYLIKHGIIIDGAIFPKGLKHSWRRLIRKIQLRGFIPAIKRVAENLIVRKRQISKMLRQIDKVYFVDDINSEEVREILVSNNVELLLLTATIPVIKPVIIDIDGLTILNPHTGWLPKYRGLDANLKALRDKNPLGVSIHKVTEKIDAGEIYLRENFQINYKEDILKQLDEEELKLSGKLLVEAVNLKSRNMLKPITTSEQLGKYEPSLTAEEKKRVIQEIKKRNV